MNHRTKTTVVCCNPVFRRGSSRMDHRTAFHVRVGLAQACPNYYNYKQLKLYENTVNYTKTPSTTTLQEAIQENNTTNITRFNAHAHRAINFLIPN